MGGADRLVVIGASLAGLRAVEAARAAGFTGAIDMLEAGTAEPYDRPPLSKEFLIQGDAEPSILRTSESIRDELDVRLHLETAARQLDSAAHTVATDDTVFEYSRAIIATGVSPRSLDWGSKPRGVHVLRTLDDADALRADLHRGANTVVIGAGFIGSEVAATAVTLGHAVTIIEAAPSPLAAAVGETVGGALAAVHERHGVRVRCGVQAQRLIGDTTVEAVILDDGTVVAADTVVIGIGATPNTGWLATSSLKLHPDGGVICDATLATSAADVWAAGDVAHWPNPRAASKLSRHEHWTSAAAQGACAGRNAVNPDLAEACGIVPYFWSDWYGQRIQFAGSSVADRVEIAYTAETDAFVAQYRTDEHLVGVLAHGEAKTFRRLRRQLSDSAPTASRSENR